MCCWQNEIHLLGDFLLNGHLELWTIFQIMDICDETQINHSCYAVCWERYKCHLPGSEEHLLIYQGRQVCDDKQALSVLVNFQAHCKMFLKVLR